MIRSGRALEKSFDLKALQYPAIAECDETHRKKGEAFSGAQTARFFVTAIEWHGPGLLGGAVSAASDRHRWGRAIQERQHVELLNR
jgi:hypothetical protein